jgi:lia operon protein LiaG
MPFIRSLPRPGQASQARRFAALLAWVGIASTLVPVAPVMAETSTRRNLSGERVAIHNLVGSLEVVPGTGSAVVAEVTLRGPDSGRLRVDEGPLRGRSTLRIVYPGNRVKVARFGGHTTSNFWVRDDGTLDGKSGEGRRVLLSGRDGIEASADVKLHVPRGAKVEIYWGHGTGDVRDIDADLAIDGAGLGVTTVGTRGALSVDIGSGTVRVRRARGSVNAETGSGDIHLDEVTGDGLSAETGSGTIRANGIDCPELVLETGSGDIEALSLRAERASLETGSGNVEVLLDSNVRSLSVESGSGNLEVLVPRPFGAAVHLETGSGGIEIDVPIEVRSRSRNEVTGTIGDGRGRLQLETGSGNIAIRSAPR